MIFIKPEINILMVFVLEWSQGLLNPNGEHVCLTSEPYEQIVEVEEPEVVLSSTWCWNISSGFRCPLNSKHNVKKKVPRMRTRIIPKCCSGYKENSQKTECIPICDNECVNGNCIAPNTCSCYPGFSGLTCAKDCPPERWGENCLEDCKCLNKGKCDKVSGRCTCEPGWTGDLCETPCPEIFFGDLCYKLCQCKPCNHITGECESPKTTSTTMKTTTTEAITNFPTTIFTTIETKTAKTPTTETTITTKPTTTAEATITTDATTITEAPITTAPTITKKLTTTTEATTTAEETTITSESITQLYFTTAIPQTFTNPEFFSGTSEHISTFTTDENPYKEKIFTTPQTSRETEDTTYANMFVTTTNDPDIYTNVVSYRINADYEKEVGSKSEAESTVSVPSTTETIPKNTDEFLTATKRADLVVTEKAEEPLENEVNFDPESVNSNSKSILNEKNKHFKMIHFVPSLTVLSGVSILFFITAMRWMIIRRRKKSQKFFLEKQEKIYNPDDFYKSRPDSIFTATNFGENPVYLSEEDLNNTPPVLQTFKPVDLLPNAGDKETIFR